MTVSHLYYGGQMVDASVNYEDFIKEPNEEQIEYDINDPCFKDLLEVMILGSKASFAYNPTDDDILNFIGKNDSKSKKSKILQMLYHNLKKQKLGRY